MFLKYMNEVYAYTFRVRTVFKEGGSGPLPPSESAPGVDENYTRLKQLTVATIIFEIAQPWR